MISTISIQKTIDLLKQLIRTKSLSKEENLTADIIAECLTSSGAFVTRVGNNVIATIGKSMDQQKPVLVLNSHHDTVKVTDGWTKDPFGATQEGDKIFGLGSNDAGASLVSLLHNFLHFGALGNLPFELVFIASAEEEISGKNGLEMALAKSGIKADAAIVGEPTGCDLAVAEKGLIVIDGVAKGKAGHAANQWGDNAIDQALKDIQWIHSHAFDKLSPWLDKVKLSVTQINAGYQHNVVPDTCSFVIDCRVNDQYSLQEIVDILQQNCESELTPRSLRLNPSSILDSHPLIQKGLSLGLHTYGSNTLSDQVFFTCPSVKIGPGDTNRSHQADEYITISEIEKGISTYKALLSNLEI